MKPRFRADYRALFWSLVLFPLVPAMSYASPQLLPWLLPLNLYLAYCAGVLTHNHNHCPTFTDKRMNRLYSAWLTVFYGFPIFSWIPTHNQNHHRYLDGPGDATQTTRRSPNNTLLNAVTYPFWSAVWQAPLIKAHIARARKRPALLRQIRVQYATLVVAHAALAAIAVGLHGARTGVLVYALAVGLPALSATWFMMFTNYLQHVECDTGSEHNHSRNFVSPLANWFVFDAGYHTVHHENPGVHWSRYRELHEARSGAIDPSLNQSSILSYCLARYVLNREPRTPEPAVQL